MRTIYIFLAVCFTILGNASFAQDIDSTKSLSLQVRRINWANFSKQSVPETEHLKKCKQILLNAARYNTKWLDSKFKIAPSGDRLQIANRNSEPVIRHPSSAALGLATVIKTGIFDPQAVGVTKEALISITIKAIKGIASIHKANGGNWGDHWQSSHWAAMVGRAGWMMWDDLDAETREMVCKFIVYEADRHIRKDYRVPYWNGKGGDSKAEENSWESQILCLAAVMMPNHRHARAWKEICSELMISAYACKSDLTRNDVSLDGKTPRQWLRGYNLRDDGIVINHGLIHNDYMSSIGHCQMEAFLMCSLAGVPVPEAADFNFDKTYSALVTRVFPSPPYKKPGGTMYIPGKAEQYYPQGTDWSRYRFACFYLMDTYAYVLGVDKKLPHKAADWMSLRADRMLGMQSRHRDGRTYARGEFDRYLGSEQFVLWVMSDAYLLLWLKERSAISAKGNWLSENTAQ